MTIKTEGLRAGEFLLSDVDRNMSIDGITVAITAAALPAGQVLGIVTASGEYAPYDNTHTDGTEVAAAILYAPLPASAAPQNGVGVVRLAPVAGSLLTGLDDAARADLKTRNIIVR
jgi:hypothetical protein